MGDVVLNARFAFHVALLDVTDKPNDFAPYRVALRIALEADAFADGALVRPIFARHGFVNDCYRGRIRLIAVAEVTATHQWNIHRPKIVSRDSRTVAVRRSLAGRESMPFNLKTAGRRMDTAQRQNRSSSGRLYNGQRAKLVEQLLIESISLRWRAVSRARQRDLHDEQTFRTKTGIDLLNALKTPNQQPRADQHHERQRHLDYH